MIRAAVIGGSGYIGGELLRLLWMHPEVEIMAVTSRKYEGKRVEVVHPHLRGTGLRFSRKISGDYDMLFLSVPHGESQKIIEEYMGSVKIIDLSADFRLPQDVYEKYYGTHERPELIDRFAYGLPELHREEIKKADYVANPGCNATAVILALYPFRDMARDAMADVKVSSSAGGKKENLMGMHAERSNVVRVYRAWKHRHEGEIFVQTGVRCPLTIHSVDIVRGVFATVYFHADTNEISLYRRMYEVYRDEIFVKIVRERNGIERYPDVKYVIGSNYVHIGATYDAESRRVILFSAIDNLIKGGAGQAIQNMNLMFGLAEDTGLKYLPLYPA
ncbi:MAG: N-acetyl-gamma-glutamyl-phosphate reductase [Thermoplasmata archaeon]|nr:N-acetyl-gamma-glutamyl-phosphate reductase [Thermoplasmata archaeon]